jgi:hypothetical protein
MTKQETKLLAALDAYVKENELQVELGVIKRMIRNGDPLEQVAFMMRDRYPLPILKALSRKMSKEGKLAVSTTASS